MERTTGAVSRQRQRNLPRLVKARGSIAEEEEGRVLRGREKKDKKKKGQ